jgi:membrane-anchored glycerophosphoryl diester phosphodiesterase (GDPDase)
MGTVLALMAVAMFRLSLVMPAVVVDGIRSPWAAIRRSWRLTRGAVGRLVWFYLLLGLAYLVLTVAVGGGISALAALALGKGAGPVVEALTGAAITAAGGAVFTAVLAMVHRQLAN